MAVSKTANKNPNPHLKIGELVPDFIMPSSSGENFQLSAHRGQKVVLYFYPKDNTPGCTIEGHEFTALKERFAALNTTVYGISRDSVKSHCGFIAKQGYRIQLLSDEDEKVCNLFDVIKEKNMYGKKVFGIERSTFVIDEQGLLLHEFRKVSAEGHAEQVLNSLQS